MYRRTGLSVSLIAAAILMLFLVTPVHATPEPEHIDGVESWVSGNVTLSGDGLWFSHAENNNANPWLTTWNLDTGVENAVNLELTTGIVGLSFENDVSPDANFDGSSIAVIARSASYPDLAMVVSPAGAEIARLSGPDEYGDEAVFEEEIFIDASGRYLTFTTNATRLTPVINGITLSKSSYVEGYESAFRLDIQTGEINLVAIKPGGAELQDYTYAMGISDGGRYVLFKSYASNLPGANGETQLYLRDMNSTAASSIILVSVDETGSPITGLACCNTEAEISDDGSRVIYTESSSLSSDFNPHTFLWSRDTGSPSLAGSAVELTAVTQQHHIKISGNGLWVTADNEVFSRLEIDTGITDPLPDNDGSPTGMDDPIISTNGKVIVFWNNALSKPVGEEGRWWILRFDQAPPDIMAPQWPNGVSLNLSKGFNSIDISWPAASDDTAVTTYFVFRNGLELAQLDGSTTSYTDSFETSGTYTYLVEAGDAAGNLSDDGPSDGITVEFLPTINIEISETIFVTDIVLTLPSVNIAITETIKILDSAAALPPVIISVTETIKIDDEVEVSPLPVAVDVIDITLPVGPLEPGAVFTAVANGFMPFIPVQAFLQSEPVLVGEEIADTNGIVTFVITVPIDFEPGDHTLILLGQGMDGSERELSAPIKVDKPSLIFRNGFE